MSFDHLPNEILERIFRLTEVKTWERNVHNCALVCRSWHLPACRVLYEKINFLKSARKLLYCLPEQRINNLGTFCKKLEISGRLYENTLLESVEFAKLLSYLPNVKQIEFDEYRDAAHYLTLFLAHRHLLRNLQEITSEFCLSKSREIQLYHECLLAFKDTIVQMRLDSLDTTIYTTADGKSGDIISYLPEFKALRNLRIINIKRQYTSGIPHLGVFTAMRSCSTLKHFAIGNTFQKAEDDDYYKDFYDHNELEYLEIDVLEITKKQIEYIVSNVPNLKTFKLRSGCDDLSQTKVKWVEKFGSEFTYKFCNYLAIIDCVDLSSEEMFAMNITELWPFARSVVINRLQLPVHLSIAVNDTKERCVPSKFVLKKEVEATYIHYGVGRDEISPALPTADAIIPFDYSEMNIRSIEISNQVLTEREIHITPAFDLIESVLNALPGLHYLHMRIESGVFKAIDVKVGSSELEYYKHPFNDIMSGRKPLPVPGPLNDRFKHVLVQKIKSTKMLASILKRLPQTKYLKLFEYKLVKDKNYNMNLDFGDLHLQYFKFDIGKIVDRSNDKQVIVIQVEEKQSGEVLLYRWQRETYHCQVVNFKRIYADFFKTGGPFKSRSTTFLIIQCFKIEEIKICLNDFEYVMATIDLGNRDTLKTINSA